MSVGGGLRLDYRDLVRAEFYYAGRLLDAPLAQEDGLQRQGMHFQVTLDAGRAARAVFERWQR